MLEEAFDSNTVRSMDDTVRATIDSNSKKNEGNANTTQLNYNNNSHLIPQINRVASHDQNGNKIGKEKNIAIADNHSVGDPHCSNDWSTSTNAIAHYDYCNKNYEDWKSDYYTYSNGWNENSQWEIHNWWNTDWNYYWKNQEVDSRDNYENENDAPLEQFLPVEDLKHDHQTAGSNITANITDIKSTKNTIELRKIQPNKVQLHFFPFKHTRKMPTQMGPLVTSEMEKLREKDDWLEARFEGLVSGSRNGDSFKNANENHITTSKQGDEYFDTTNTRYYDNRIVLDTVDGRTGEDYDQHNIHSNFSEFKNSRLDSDLEHEMATSPTRRYLIATPLDDSFVGGNSKSRSRSPSPFVVHTPSYFQMKRSNAFEKHALEELRNNSTSREWMCCTTRSRSTFLDQTCTMFSVIILGLCVII